MCSSRTCGRGVISVSEETTTRTNPVVPLEMEGLDSELWSDSRAPETLRALCDQHRKAAMRAAIKGDLEEFNRHMVNWSMCHLAAQANPDAKLLAEHLKYLTKFGGGGQKMAAAPSGLEDWEKKLRSRKPATRVS